MPIIPPNLTDYIRGLSDEGLKLHLGCGGMRWKDFINVDLYPGEPDKIDSSRSGFVADAIGDMRCLNLPHDSVSEIFTSHTVDHFCRWEAIEMFEHWYMLLKPGGRLVVELADFNRCILWLFHPRNSKRLLAKNQFYGNQWDEIDYETHRYVWSARELKHTLLSLKYEIILITHETETHVPGRDMRFEVRKPLR